MRAVIQKSGKANVEINNQIHSEIESGLVILVGINNDDTSADIDYLVEKISNLRLFEEGEKHFEKSILDTKKEALIISQFTLYASCEKGRRPDFNQAAKPEIAKPMYQEFINKMKEKGIKVKTGIFGAMMNVTLRNEGPITIIINSKS
ncbi:MAG: D-aminoacyl-tRNA deacylase [bacterium]|nr:D-aminoacyl-tRNA deacylase [bacterium]